MNNFTKKGIVQKIIIALIFLVVFNFVYPYIPAYAAEDDDAETESEAPGGVLLEPLFNLISALGEGIIWIIQSQLLGLPASNVYVETSDGDFWSALAGVLSGIAAAGAVVAGVILSPFTFGTSAALAAAGVGVLVGVTVGTFVGDQFPDNFYLPIYKISPQEIFSDQVPILHINFINPRTYDTENDGSSGALPVYNSAKVLGPQISNWYVAIRNLVLVGLMVVLLYIGIRIVVSSTAGEKAKYKEHIKDWLIAVILVIFMHYIMAFALTLTEYITGMLISQNQTLRFEISEDNAKAIVEALGGGNTSDFKDPNDGKYYIYTNLMGYARIMQQMDTRDDVGNQQFTWTYIGYTIIYMVLVIYTVMFLIIYLKRVIYMAFLTMIAPLVALTYPIDKISDGQAQAFNMWLKEYVYNLLLQPFHLLLYTMLVGSVMDLAANNMIYAIVALGFLMPAEQLLRRFFGFEKASTTGSIVGGVVGGSLAMNAINKLGRIGSGSHRPGGGKGGSGDSGDGESTDKTKIRTADSGNSTDSLLQSGFGGDDSSGDGDTGGVGPAILGSGGPSDNSSVRMSNNANPSLNAGTSPTNNDDVPAGYMRSNSGLYIPDNRPLEIRRPSNGGAGSSSTVTAETTTPRPLVPSNEAGRVGSSTGNIRVQEQPQGRWARIKNSNGGKTVIAGAKTGAKYTGKALASIGKKAPRLVTKAALGAAIGTVGVAAGVASGDWSNIAAYGAAAAGVGASLGDGVSNIAGNAAGSISSNASAIRQDYMNSRYTREERKQRENARLDKQWRQSKDTINLYKDHFGDHYEEAMQAAQKYREQGITDDKAIIAAQKLEGLRDADVASQERMAYAKVASSVKSDKELKDYNKRLEELGIPADRIKEINRNVREMNEM